MNVQQAPIETTAIREAPGSTGTHLRGNLLIVARIMWIAGVILALGLFAVSIPGFFASLHVVCVPNQCNFGLHLSTQDARALQSLGISLNAYATLQIIFSLLFTGVSAGVGLVIFWRKFDDPMGLLGSFTLILLGITGNQNTLSTLPPSWNVLVGLVILLGNVSGTFWLYLFPGRRFAPRWIRWVALALIPFWIADAFFPAFSNAFVTFVITLGVLLSWILVQIYRYRRVSTVGERQQTKWVVYGLVVALGAYLIELVVLFLLLPHFFQPSTLFYAIGQAITNCFILAFPLSVGFAVLRYRLYDIDILINRSLVYSTLTGSLILIYFALILLVQFLVNELTGHIIASSQVNQSPLVIVCSTLAVVALFQPLRRGIQRGIDRRFYRRKYDAARTLAAFSATLRNEVDLNQLREQLLEVVQETMQPSHVSLWIRAPSRTEIPSSQIGNAAPQETRIRDESAGHGV